MDGQGRKEVKKMDNRGRRVKKTQIFESVDDQWMDNRKETEDTMTFESVDGQQRKEREEATKTFENVDDW